MHAADQFIAFRDMVKSGLSIEEVAARFGVTTLFVRQRLKLANVVPRFIEDYRAGALQLEQLEALAITDDHATQERVWDSAQNWERSSLNLRRLLTEKKVSSSDKRAIFVGVETYSDAGGVIEQDLFDALTELATATLKRTASTVIILWTSLTDTQVSAVAGSHAGFDCLDEIDAGFHVIDIDKYWLASEVCPLWEDYRSRKFSCMALQPRQPLDGLHSYHIFYI